MEPKTQDTVTIAPSVLLAIVKQAALDVRGVVRMGIIPVAVDRLLRSQPAANGVVLAIAEDERVEADVYLVVGAGTQMREVGKAVQKSIIRAVEDLVGMNVTRVSVHIEDVDYLPADG